MSETQDEKQKLFECGNCGADVPENAERCLVCKLKMSSAPDGAGEVGFKPKGKDVDLHLAIDRHLMDQLPHEIQHKLIRRINKEEALRADTRLNISRMKNEDKQKRNQAWELNRQKRVARKLNRDIGKAARKHENKR